MATIYCDSAGSNTSPYDTWAKAATTLTTALGAWTTGDTILIKSTSTVAGTASFSGSGGAIATPIPIYTANASDVYTLATSSNPTLNLTDSGADWLINIQGDMHGFYVFANDDINIAQTGTFRLTDCTLVTASNNAAIYLGSGGNDTYVVWSRVDVDTDSGTTVNFSSSSGGLCFEWNGGAFLGTANAGGLFRGSARYFEYIIRGVDFSGADSLSILCDTSASSDGQQRWRFINCKIASGTAITDGTLGNDGQEVELISCEHSGNGGLLYDYTLYSYRATITTDTSTYLTAGFQDASGDTHCSRAITPNSVFQDAAAQSGEMMFIYNSTTGSSITIRIYAADDFTSAPNDLQAYIEVLALDSAGEILFSHGTSRPSDLVSGGGALTTTSGAWTGSPGHQYYMEYTFTPQVAGWLGVKVWLANIDLSSETSNSFFYDPEINIV